ncbi:glycerate kinase, partial [Mycolicibacterium insubricum]|nr:glycerate kinase [Mycolicibacterium insubricum]
MRVLIAPDCFGDSLTAVAAAEAIAAGWRSARPDDVLKLAPQSDGGPGFVDVLAARNGTRHRVPVAGPLADTVDADWVSIGDTAYLESAQACGLALLPDRPRRTPRWPRTAGRRRDDLVLHRGRRDGAGALVGGVRRVVAAGHQHRHRHHQCD